MQCENHSMFAYYLRATQRIHTILFFSLTLLNIQHTACTYFVFRSIKNEEFHCLDIIYFCCILHRSVRFFTKVMFILLYSNKQCSNADLLYICIKYVSIFFEIPFVTRLPGRSWKFVRKINSSIRMMDISSMHPTNSNGGRFIQIVWKYTELGIKCIII